VRQGTTGVLLSRPHATLPPPTQSPFTAETAITTTCQMSVYNFCRRRSACPADTQCQSEIGKEQESVSYDEVACHGSVRNAHLSQRH
jgi:hypothetical protein